MRAAAVVLSFFYLLCASLLTVPSASAAQEPAQQIPDRVVCPRCSHDLVPVVALGNDDGPGALAGEPKFLLRLSDGRYVTAEYPTATRILIFRADGTFEREIGREGEGPGEFLSISAAYITPDGHLRVFDRALRRETEFDEGFEFASIRQMSGLDTEQIILGPDQRVYYNADVLTADRTTLPVHVMDNGGRIVRSFGTPTGDYRPDAPEMGQRAMAAVQGGVWIAPRTHYLLQLWTADGERRAALERRIDWFEPYVMRAAITRTSPPQPWVMALGRATDSTITTLVNVAGRDFADALTVVGRSGAQEFYDTGDCDTLMDTIIEVIHVRRRQVMSSSRRDECLIGFIGDNVYGYRLQDGNPHVQIYELRRRTGGN